MKAAARVQNIENLFNNSEINDIWKEIKKSETIRFENWESLLNLIMLAQEPRAIGITFNPDESTCINRLNQICHKFGFDLNKTSDRSLLQVYPDISFRGLYRQTSYLIYEGGYKLEKRRASIKSRKTTDDPAAKTDFHILEYKLKIKEGNRFIRAGDPNEVICHLILQGNGLISDKNVGMILEQYLIKLPEITSINTDNNEFEQLMIALEAEGCNPFSSQSIIAMLGAMQRLESSTTFKKDVEEWLNGVTEDLENHRKIRDETESLQEYFTHHYLISDIEPCLKALTGYAKALKIIPA